MVYAPLRVEGMNEIIDDSELVNLPAKKREDALRKLGIVHEFRAFRAELEKGDGGTHKKAIALFGQAKGVSGGTIERWISAYGKMGLVGLVDNRGGGKFRDQMISPGAFELFKSLYLDPREPTLTQCWKNLCFINKDEKRGWRIPALSAMYNYVTEFIPDPARVLHRKGLAAYEAKFGPYIQSDPETCEPGEVWIADHCAFNFWIRHHGGWIRPWITSWQDYKSRLIVGWHISACPNQTTILLAMRRALDKYGPPDIAKIDNGKDFSSEMWTGETTKTRRFLGKEYLDKEMIAGLYAMLDIQVSFAIAYHPQAKGRLERWFDTIDLQLSKTIATYCGKEPAGRREDIKEVLENQKTIREAYDLESFTKVAGEYISAYNRTAHSGEGMDGRSPAEVFETRPSIRVLQAGVAELLCRVWSKELIVGKNGVKVKEMWYGQYNLDLLVQQGKKVRAAYDPDDMRSVYVYDAKTLRLITAAEQNHLVAYGRAVNEDELRDAMRQKAKAVRFMKGFKDAQLTANMDLTSLTIRAMQDAARPEPEPNTERTLRPVRTPLDGQVREHERQRCIKAIKKAAGAESMETALDFDFSLLRRREELPEMDFGLEILR
jgi:putative transposase